MYVCALGTEMSHLHHSGDPRKVKVPVSFFLLLPFPKNIQRVYTIPKRGHARAVLLLDTEKIKKKTSKGVERRRTFFPSNRVEKEGDG